MDSVKKRVAEDMLVRQISDLEFDKCRALAASFGLDVDAVRRRATELNLARPAECTLRAMHALSAVLDVVANSCGEDRLLYVRGVPLVWGEHENAIRDVVQVVLGRYVIFYDGVQPFGEDQGTPASVIVGMELEGLFVAHGEFLRKVLEIKKCEIDEMSVQLAKRARKGDAAAI